MNEAGAADRLDRTCPPRTPLEKKTKPPAASRSTAREKRAVAAQMTREGASDPWRRDKSKPRERMAASVGPGASPTLKTKRSARRPVDRAYQRHSRPFGWKGVPKTDVAAPKPPSGPTLYPRP